MDGVEGQGHPWWGAEVMRKLFGDDWARLCCLHSRTIANKYFAPLSRLGYADKLAFLYYPKWLLKILYALSGEGTEYLKNNNMTDWDQWYDVAAEHNIKTLKSAHK